MINRWHFFVLFLLTSFAAFNAVLFTPSMPKMIGYFAVSGNKVQTVILFYLLGYSFGQLFYGPIANRCGRKPTLYGGILLEIFSSILCIYAVHFHLFNLLVIGRFFLAVGAGVGLVVAYAIVNESYSRKEASKKISYLTLSFAVSPGVSIFIGSLLLAHAGILGCFYASFVYGVILIFFCMTLPETLIEKHFHALKPKQLIKGYKVQICNIKVMLAGVVMGANASYIYIFAAMAPFIAMLKFKVNAIDYGTYNILPPIGLVLGSILSAKLSGKYSIKQLILSGLIILSLGICCMVILNNVNINNVFINLFLPIIIVYVGSSLVHPSAIMFGMSSSDNKANASAMLNFLNLGIVSIADVFLMYCKINLGTMILSFAMLCLIEIIIYILVINRS